MPKYVSKLRVMMALDTCSEELFKEPLREIVFIENGMNEFYERTHALPSFRFEAEKSTNKKPDTFHLDLESDWGVMFGRLALKSDGSVFDESGEKVAVLDPEELVCRFLTAAKLATQLKPERFSSTRDNDFETSIEDELDELAAALLAWENIHAHGADDALRDDGVILEEKREEILELKEAIALRCLGHDMPLPPLLFAPTPKRLPDEFTADAEGILNKGKMFLNLLVASPEYDAAQRSPDENATFLFAVERLKENIRDGKLRKVRNLTFRLKAEMKVLEKTLCAESKRQKRARLKP